MLGLLLKLGNLLNNLMGKGESGNPPNTQGSTGPTLDGNEKGWLVNHGDYPRNTDRSFTINKGEWAGYTATPTGDKGSYEVTNTSSGEIVGTYNSPGGQSNIASTLTFDLNGNGEVDTTTTNKQYDIDIDIDIDDRSDRYGNGFDALEGAAYKNLEVDPSGWTHKLIS